MALRDKVKPIYSGKELYSFMDKRDKYDARSLKKIAPTAVFKYDRDTPLHLNVSSDFQRSLRDKLLHAEDIGELYKGATINQEGTGTLEDTSRKGYMMGNMAQAILLKKGRLKDHYQNKFSLGIAPRYNPIGYIGRGYGAWKGRGERSIPDKYQDLLGGKINVGKVEDPELTALRYTEDMKDDEYLKAMKARGDLYKNKKGNYEEIARGDIKHNLRFQSNFSLTPVVKKYSLSEAVYLPLIGGATSSAVGLYDNSFGSMKDMPKYNKRNFQIGSALVGTGAGLALSDAHPALRGAGFLTGVTGMELMRRSKFGPRVGEISNIAGDGSSTIAAVNGSGL